MLVCHDPFDVPSVTLKATPDAQGDLLRGLQVVESASGIPTALLGDHIEGMYVLNFITPIVDSVCCSK